MTESSVATRLDIHERHSFFEYAQADKTPPLDRTAIDVAVLDLNHSWPNIGHDSLVHAILELAVEEQDRLSQHGLRVRVTSFDVRRRLALPESPSEHLSLYLATGGPGHLDPRENDGVKEWAQGIRETADWEAPLFKLFDDIHRHESASLLAVCHSFGLLCRWSGVAHVSLRERKSRGVPSNVLTDEATAHPWFSKFSRELADGRHFRVVDNRLFDLIYDGGAVPIAVEEEGSSILTMAEFARLDGMPRILGVNHHPEIVDREHALAILETKKAHHEVSDEWVEERVVTIGGDMRGDAEKQSRITSKYTLIEPLRFHLARLIDQRIES